MPTLSLSTCAMALGTSIFYLFLDVHVRMSIPVDQPRENGDGAVAATKPRPTTHHPLTIHHRHAYPARRPHTNHRDQGPQGGYQRLFLSVYQAASSQFRVPRRTAKSAKHRLGATWDFTNRRQEFSNSHIDAELRAVNVKTRLGLLSWSRRSLVRGLCLGGNPAAFVRIILSALMNKIYKVYTTPG